MLTFRHRSSFEAGLWSTALSSAAHAESDGPGKGAAFTIHLPVRAVRPSAAPDGGERIGGQEGPRAAFSQLLTGIRVLVVDDEADARDMISTALAAYECDVRAEASAAQALEQLRLHRFDVLISDVGMPGEGGYEFIQKVRQLSDETARSIPAVALTAYGRAEDSARALAAGFHVHLTKPVATDALASTIAQLVRGSETA